jgi:hypothetical protein
VFADMFECAYCTGFHTGWMTWVLLGTSWSGLLVYPLVSAIGCYLVDTIFERLGTV